MDRTIDYYIEQIRPYFATTVDASGNQLYGNRSHLYHILRRIAGNDEMIERASRRAIELVANGIRGGSPAGSVAMNLGNSIGYISGYTPDQPPKVTEKGILAMGRMILHWFALEKLINMKKLSIENSKHFQWFMIPRGDFADMCIKQSVDTRYPPLTDGPFVWVEPIAMINDAPMELVKKSIRAKMVGYYTQHKMPLVYQSINKCNAQTWKINNHILNLINNAKDGNPFLPSTVSVEELIEAREQMRTLKFKASYYKDFIMNEVLSHTGLDDDIVERIATGKTKQMVSEKSVDFKEVASAFDKQRAFYRLKTIANDVVNQQLNFTYSMDSRGRIYACQPHLQPLGEDAAKALLCYGKQYPVELYDLAIVTANLMGEDKVPFDERVAYVNNNMDLIRELGRDPWNNIEELEKLELSKSDKWQALAIFNVWHRFHEWIEAGNSEDTFTSSVPINYDGSNQGLQILSIISRDEFCGPKVNIAPHYDENGEQSVGDIYAYIGDFLPEWLRTVPEDKQSPELKTFTDYIANNPSKRRKVVKRNVMTRSYACTRFGCGEQHLQDRKDYGFDEVMNLTLSNCFTLGAAVYDITQDKLGKSSDVMSWLQEGIKHIPEDNPVVKWVLPDGFTAFTYKEQTTHTSDVGMIGKTKVTLIAHVRTGKVNRNKQKSAIAPSVVHSLDAYILRTVVLNMPSDAPFSAVHDSFGTASCYAADLVETTREAYKSVGDRTMIEQMMADCFNKFRLLPLPGKLSIEDLDKTDYFIS